MWNLNQQGQLDVLHLTSFAALSLKVPVYQNAKDLVFSCTFRLQASILNVWYWKYGRYVSFSSHYLKFVYWPSPFSRWNIISLKAETIGITFPSLISASTSTKSNSYLDKLIVSKRKVLLSVLNLFELIL